MLSERQRTAASPSALVRSSCARSISGSSSDAVRISACPRSSTKSAKLRRRWLMCPPWPLYATADADALAQRRDGEGSRVGSFREGAELDLSPRRVEVPDLERCWRRRRTPFGILGPGHRDEAPRGCVNRCDRPTARQRRPYVPRVNVLAQLTDGVLVTIDRHEGVGAWLTRVD